jgi:ParB family chromosome partitioning protein
MSAEEQAALWRDSPKDRIDSQLARLAVDLATLTLDPLNMRLHPVKNMAAIKDSLCVYGQKKPVVVRKEGLIVVAGNGTVQAARELGWTKIAASISSMTDEVARGYGWVDNRTAELARWNLEIMARIDKLQQETSHPIIGWTVEEMLVVRQGDGWEPTNKNGQVVENKWQVLVDCTNEQEQLALITLLSERGHTCRALTF